MGQQDGDLPARTGKVVKRFERWRRTRKKRTPIPEALWEAAVDLARAYGTSPVARLCRLDYYALERRVKATEAEDEVADHSFVEVDMLPTTGHEECQIEFSDGNGAKMLIRASSSRDLDISSLVASFLRRSQ